MSPILELTAAWTTPTAHEGLELDPDEVLLARAADRARGAADGGAPASPPAPPRPARGFASPGDELAWLALKLLQRRSALRRALGVAGVDGSAAISRAAFVAAFPRLNLGPPVSAPALDAVFAGGDVTFAALLALCLRVVDRRRVSRQFRDALRKLAIIEETTPAAHVPLALRECFDHVHWRITRSGSVPDYATVVAVEIMSSRWCGRADFRVHGGSGRRSSHDSPKPRGVSNSYNS